MPTSSRPCLLAADLALGRVSHVDGRPNVPTAPSSPFHTPSSSRSLVWRDGASCCGVPAPVPPMYIPGAPPTRTVEPPVGLDGGMVAETGSLPDNRPIAE